MSTCRLCQLFTDSSAGSSSETKTGTNVEYDLRFFDMNSAGNSVASSWHQLVLDSEYYETAGAIVN